MPVFSLGFQFGLAYTCGRTLAPTRADGDFGRIDNLTQFANYGTIAAIGRRQTIAANCIYDLSAMFGKHEIVLSLMDGWRNSGLTRFQSGAPFSVPTTGNQQLEGSQPEGARIQLVRSPIAATTDSPYNRINAAGFSPPSCN